VHQPLRIGPGTFSHLDLANVGQQSFRAPAQYVLLNAHGGNEADNGHKECEARNPNQSTPTHMESHTSLDTGMGTFVPIRARGVWEFREIFEQL
jgi:hypothetical protein